VTAPIAPTAAPRRDAEATRDRILNAALAEFAADGLAGARIQSIARRAGVNVRMLYHYFGDKDDLFRAILRRRFADRPMDPGSGPATLGAMMTGWFERRVADPDWVRLSLWEALEGGDRPVVAEEDRARGWARLQDRLRAEQAAGRLADDLDIDCMLLALVALSSFPAAFAPTVRMVTGASPTDEEFRRRYRRFLERLSEHLRPAEVAP
jgi:TetR/AcrR family transcriptional regulator